MIMDIGNMSLIGGIVILLVLLIRFFLKRSPKKYAYSLWGVVLFRLLCPVSFTAGFSLVGWVRSWFLPENLVRSTYTVQTEGAAVDGPTVIFQTGPILSAVNPEQTQTVFQASVHSLNILGWIWLAGALFLLVYGLVQYFRLRRTLEEAVCRTGNVYLVDHIPSPFVLGLFRPRIYLPTGLAREEQRFILAHEREHIRRLDPLWKFLGYGALCIHWFNPLVWLAFFLAGKDMEMSCDEAVIAAMGPQIRADYAQALLQLATHKTRIAGMPLAFGEGETKTRVKNLVKWKKPKIWVSGLCGVVCIVVAVLCIFSTKEKYPDEFLEGPAGLSVGDFYFDIPEGCTYRTVTQDVIDSDWKERTFTLLADGKEIGGVMVFPVPEDLTGIFWEKLPLPEWQDESLGYFGDNNSLEFFADVPPGGELALSHFHHFYAYEDRIYDLWFDQLTAGEAMRREILESVSLGRPSEKQSSLPDWVRQVEEDGALSFYRGEELVGQLVTYTIPEGVFDPIDTTFQWLDNMDIPDLHDPSLLYSGGITDVDWGWQATYVSLPGAGKEVERTHWFYPAGEILYDLWVDGKTLSRGDQYAIRAAFTFEQPEKENAETPAKDAAFARCKEVMDYAIWQDVSIHSVLTYENHPEKNVIRDYMVDNDAGMLQTVATQDGTTANLEFQNRMLIGTDTGSGMQWDEVSSMEYNCPWMNTFDFIGKYMTYVDTLETDEGICYMFISKVPLWLGEELAELYCPNFYFDKDGNFLRVQIQGNLFQEDAFTLVESFVTTDSAAISAEIEAAYQQAIQ